MPYQPLPEALRAAKPASEHTQRAQAKVREQLDFADRQSFDDAAKGFIATLEPLTLQRDSGRSLTTLHACHSSREHQTR